MCGNGVARVAVLPRHIDEGCAYSEGNEQHGEIVQTELRPVSREVRTEMMTATAAGNRGMSKRHIEAFQTDISWHVETTFCETVGAKSASGTSSPTWNNLCDGSRGASSQWVRRRFHCSLDRGQDELT